MIDVMYIEVWETQRVLSKSGHATLGIIEERKVDIIDFMIQNSESVEICTTFFVYLKQRRWCGIQHEISDVHPNLVAGIRQSFALFFGKDIKFIL